MTDIAINPTGTPEYRMQGRLVPTYLVTLDIGKKETYFIATKFDESSNYGKFVGFYYTGTIVVNELASKLDEIIRSTDPINFVEIIFPWTRIQSIRSLIYKHKATGEKK